MMKEIPLTKGQVALVDDDDFEWLSQWRWFYATAHTGYAERVLAKSKHLKMHRAIMEHHEYEIEGKSIDHINGNTLDNTKANLRICTHAQNLKNQRLSANNTSGYKGVSLAVNGKWLASISVDGKRIGYGTYDDIYSAVTIYNLAARYHHGEFARLNELPSCLTVNPLYIRLPKHHSVAERIRELFTAMIPRYRGQLGNWETLAQKYTEMHNRRLKNRNHIIPYPTPPAQADERKAS